MVGGEGHEENRQSQLLLCKVHQVHAGRRLVILENKMGGENDYPCQAGQDKCTRKLAVISGFW